MSSDPREDFRKLMLGPKLSLAELKVVLQSQLFKDFAATYPKQSGDQGGHSRRNMGATPADKLIGT